MSGEGPNSFMDAAMKASNEDCGDDLEEDGPECTSGAIVRAEILRKLFLGAFTNWHNVEMSDFFS